MVLLFVVPVPSNLRLFKNRADIRWSNDRSLYLIRTANASRRSSSESSYVVFSFLAAYWEQTSSCGCCPFHNTCGNVELPTPIGDGFQGGMCVRTRTSALESSRGQHDAKTMQLQHANVAWMGQHLVKQMGKLRRGGFETTPPNLPHSNQNKKRAALKRHNQLQHTNVKTTPINSNLVTRFP